MTKSSIETLSGLTGIKMPDMASIYDQVKANSARLRSCGAHAFEPLPGQESKPMGKRYVCTICRGEVDCHAYYWHEIGRKSGGAQ